MDLINFKICDPQCIFLIFLHDISRAYFEETGYKSWYFFPELLRYNNYL